MRKKSLLLLRTARGVQHASRQRLGTVASEVGKEGGSMNEEKAVSGTFSARRIDISPKEP